MGSLNHIDMQPQGIAVNIYTDTETHALCSEI